MKKFFVVMLCLMAMTAMAQKVKRAIVPGKGGIDVEQLNKRVNLDQDISQLSLSMPERASLSAMLSYVACSSVPHGMTH